MKEKDSEILKLIENDENYFSSFDYKDVEGNEYVFHLMREETEDGK